MATMASHARHSTHGSISFSPDADQFDVPMKSYSPTTTAFLSDMLDTSGPLPNPPFVFPARQAPSSAPASFSRGTGRQTRSSLELQGPGPGYSSTAKSSGKSVPAPLPSFSFGGASAGAPKSPDSGMNSPPQSPNSPTGRSAPRSGGHRRGGSEFIGGDGKQGTGTILMSTSPIKADGSLPSPSLAPSMGPSAGRRGHAHRRSAAISCHDLSMILNPTSATGTPGGSAPTSPSEPETQRFNFNVGPRHGLTSSVSDPTIMTKGPTSSPPRSPQRDQTRARVGFSDTLEFIPRPLSLVSSDTSSTATMRPGHSVSGSLSSIVSGGGTSSPPTKEQRGLPSPAQSVSNESRPSTAGPVLGNSGDNVNLRDDVFDSGRRNSLPFAVDEPLSTSSDVITSPKGLRKYHFFGYSDGEASPTRSRPVSAASMDKQKVNVPTPRAATDIADEPVRSVESPIPTQQRRPSITRKPSKKQKKVRSWAGSILSRKTRPRSNSKPKAMSRRSPTPPLRNYDVYELQTPISTQPTIEEGALPQISPALPALTTNFASWKPRHLPPPEDDTMSPIIDLDAALGPFNTPTALSYDPAWEASQAGGRFQKKRMHSNGLASRSFRPGDSTFHRRSESAPEMDNPRFSMNRLGSSSTMADVFEEDEEDDWEEARTVSHKNSAIQVDDEAGSIAVNVVDSDSISETAAMDWTTADAEQRGIKRKGSGLSEGERRQVSGSSTKSVHSTVSLKDVPIIEEAENPIRIVDDTIASGFDSTSPSSGSTLTPPLRANAPKTLAPVEIKQGILPQPFLTPASPNSSFPSPFPSPRSPMSYDAQRISTAPSSFTDENTFESLLLGEPGPEVRMSVDDVPSLTSSTSTMTRDSMNNPVLTRPRIRGSQRSASLSDPAITRKRSSIASLSRLLHSSHGEKSPLSSEMTAPDLPDKKEKKAKRLSRMMNFFKPKDASTS